MEVPWVDGALSAGQVRETAASIAAMQESDGAIPWTVGEHVDVWNHVEAAMALLIGGQPDAAEKALRWCVQRQRSDGSWAMKYVAGAVEDSSGESNMNAYLAVGLWHHWLVRGDFEFVCEIWPTVRRGLDWVVDRQLPFGGIAWSQEYAEGVATTLNEEALLAGSSSIYQSLRAGVALADLVHEPQPDWELAGGRLGHAIRHHSDEFADKSEFSMDWYYPVLGGAVRGPDAETRIAAQWDRFVVPDLGIRCVAPDPWVTGAETCELAMALDAIGLRREALQLLQDMQHLRDTEGRYCTGYVYPDKVRWPPEHTTYTAAAVLLAVDAIGDWAGHSTPGSGIMRGASLAPQFPEMALECGCDADASERSGPQ